MGPFFHIRILITIILGLSITHLLKGTAKFIQHPNRDRAYSLHLLWVLYVFLLIVHFWWWEYRLTWIEHWSFASYFFVIIYATIFYLISILLYPEDIKDYSSYEDYFFSRKTWFFAALAVSYALDIGDTLLKGKEYFRSLRLEYPIRNIVHIALCLAAIKIKNRKVQAAIVLLFIVYELTWIFRLFNTL